MQARLLAFVIWAAVAASAVFWLLRLWSSSPTAPAHTVAVPAAAPPKADLTRVFGAPAAAPASTRAAPVEPALASRFKLLGVAAPRERDDGAGLALIAVDGKPARGFKVGAVVDGNLVLQAVHPRGAAIGVSGAAPSVSLELPAVPGSSLGAGRSPGLPPPAAWPLPPAGGMAPSPTALVPPPPQAGPIPGMRLPETAEASEPQQLPVANSPSR
jgi:general secretion pathway protein C